MAPALRDDKMSSGSIEYLFNHVFLPPKLPQSDDFDTGHDLALLHVTIDALTKFRQLVTSDQLSVVDAVATAVVNMRNTISGLGIEERELKHSLGILGRKGGIIPVHICAQNCAVMIRKENDSIILEAFELSPSNAAVITTKGRLKRSFPGPAISVDACLFEQPEFQTTVAETLTKMSHQSAAGTTPQAKKAGAMLDEDRDTTHPRMVTELFMAFLRSLGKAAIVSRIGKHTREEVMWCGSRRPWRRSPTWLLLRVTMQLIFVRHSRNSGSSNDLYKNFLVFLMSQILELAYRQKDESSSELLYSMNAKLARRLLKLNTTANYHGLNIIHKIMSKTAELLDERWTLIRKCSKPHFDSSCLKNLNFLRDIHHSLEGLDNYIEMMRQRKSDTISNAFMPSHGLLVHKENELPSLKSSIDEYIPYNFRAFEAWATSKLGTWLESNKLQSGTCGKLGALAQQYHHAATPIYSGDAEATSLMLLTITELWVACDKSATAICKLLLDYSPGFSADCLQCLVLPTRDQMERLQRVETYLSTRRAHAKCSSVFKDFGKIQCFSVRYFNQSEGHQRLLKNIERDADVTRAAKRRELEEMKDKYNSLMARYSNSECEYGYVVVDTYNNFSELRHRWNCSRCNYKSQASNMRIEIHEWPLPSNTLEAKSTVFELKVPESFGHWRDMTMFLVLDVFKNRYIASAAPRSSYSLESYSGLLHYCNSSEISHQRISLLSENKPHGVTHRSNPLVATATESQVCLENGLSYRYFDRHTAARCFVTDFELTDEVMKSCTYNLPEKSFALQQFLFRPSDAPNGPPPNTVISSQSKSPEHMSLDEYKTLCTIPLGYRIQWHNIMLQLYSPSVDLRKVETNVFILQCIYQAGPNRDGLIVREGHEILRSEKFVKTFLEGLHRVLSRIRANWESSQALSSLTSLAARLLSLTSSKSPARRFLEFLSAARATAMEWLMLLKKKARHTTVDKERQDFRFKAAEMALICANSFNIDQQHLIDLLSISSDAAILVQCSIVIQECESFISRAGDSTIIALYHRWQGLSYRCYPLLLQEIVNKNNTCLDTAIKTSWAAYKHGRDWRTSSDQHHYWLVNETPSDKSASLSIHFDLLSGELLVNGIPLARLPSQYESHPLYHTIFGNSSLEIRPSNIPGMQFSSKDEFAGYALHFALNYIANSGSSRECDLLVKAVTHDDQIYELLPSRIFRGLFPTAFVEDFVHWYNFKDHFIEFRPIKDPWTISLVNWRLSKVNSHWRLSKENINLINIKSETAQVLSNILSPLEDSLRIHNYFHTSSLLLEITLPRLQLEFSLEPMVDLIQSRQFRGFSIDQNQTLDTLVGLSSKLIMVQDNGHNRLVIVPDGQITYSIQAGHTLVTVSKDSINRAHAYHIDDQLGRLVDNGNLQSKLFLCYLHALTSFCLPDPLTGSTGTEQALSVLNSAAVKSFQSLTQENVKILEQIGGLSPRRHYYPANERVMQTVDWSPVLGFLAQHDRFYQLVSEIFSRANRAQVFNPHSQSRLLELKYMELFLLERNSIRTATFRISGFGAEDHTSDHDVVYSTRDRYQNSPQATRAFVLSDMIYHRRKRLPFELFNNLKEHLWVFLAQVPEIFGPSHTLEFSQLKYDSSLLLGTTIFLAKYWCPIHRVLSLEKSQLANFDLMIWLSTLAFATNVVSDRILQTMAAFFALPEMERILAPHVCSFQPNEGYAVKTSTLQEKISTARLPYPHCPEAQLPARKGESMSAWDSRRRAIFTTKSGSGLEKLTNALEIQFPCEVPSSYINDPDITVYFDVERAVQGSKPLFKIWNDNLRLHEFICEIVRVLESYNVVQQVIPPTIEFTPAWTREMKHGFVSVDDIFAISSPPTITLKSENVPDWLTLVAGCHRYTFTLLALIERLESCATSRHEEEYVKDLRNSLHSLKGFQDNHELPKIISETSNVKETLLSHLNASKDHAKKIYNDIQSSLGSSICSRENGSFKMALGIKQYPRLSVIFLLQQLTRHRWPKISNEWKYSIAEYGIALTTLQRAQRLVNLADNHVGLVRELVNRGHINWDPMKFPESLLLEIENGLMIREVQEQIAQVMRDPSSAKNAIMQLNMGEGKSTVIVPIVASPLADGSRLVRVIVAKPQARQMFQMLVAKFGGLLDRQIYHMPFSRALKLEESEADTIREICKECMVTGGILLVQPEHILSLKLMSIECLITGREDVGKSLVETLKFFESYSRDIVDESDENFSTRFELIYTMGMQRPIDLSPERWLCTMQVLSLIREYAPEITKEYPRSIEVDERSPAGSFPRLRFLGDDGQHKLLTQVAEHICETGLNGLPVSRQPSSFRQKLFKYITNSLLSDEEIARVEKHEFWTSTTSGIILLLRGLFAGDVLAFTFRLKRWRVNYGLHSKRQPPTKLAVPYRAKDNPTARSEFSHPDVVILLTSLTYYYGGLSDDDLFLAFEHLFRSDQADIEYGTWIKDAPDLPSHFRELVGINLKDRFQCIKEIFPFMRYAKSAVDYFLAHIVFPKEIKEFPHKLSSSGWDIGQTKAHPTTGFSGTIDSRKTLPLGVEYLDLEKQKHTNALVLENLLKPENSISLMQARRGESCPDAICLLTMITEMRPATKVIIDVGAQILDLNNLEVAKEWLQLSSSYGVQAAVYLDDNDELFVLDRKGNIESLQTSSFQKQLDLCVIFLDDAHTRGTDLKLPIDYRAAVTLGPNVTKDRLVQACMRMRELGRGQSVTFCVPEEIEIQIRARTKKLGAVDLDVSDVLLWAVMNTHVDIRRSMPLWAAQGKRYETQKAIWSNMETQKDTSVLARQACDFLEDESQSLETRYRPRSTADVPSVFSIQNENLNSITERCQEFNDLKFNSAALQEEQERELSPENEQERQIQRPAPSRPADHLLHPDLVRLVATGSLNLSSSAYGPAFETLHDSSAAEHFSVSQFPQDLFVTTDFARTVQIVGTSYISDSYQRSSQWILIARGLKGTLGQNNVAHIIVISPFEAQELMPRIATSKNVTLHLYAPRSNLNFASLDNLDLYCIPEQPMKLSLPRSVVMQLNIFAGQLYLNSFNEYHELCEFLGIASEKTGEGWVVAADGFILERGDSTGKSFSVFKSSPTKFLKVFLAKIRRNGEGIEKTHIGRILDGELLDESDFDKLDNRI